MYFYKTSNVKYLIYILSKPEPGKFQPITLSGLLLLAQRVQQGLPQNTHKLECRAKRAVFSFDCFIYIFMLPYSPWQHNCSKTNIYPTKAVTRVVHALLHKNASDVNRRLRVKLFCCIEYCIVFSHSSRGHTKLNTERKITPKPCFDDDNSHTLHASQSPWLDLVVLHRTTKWTHQPNTHQHIISDKDIPRYTYSVYI